ncbi:MAG: GNAT family N-acetyltransferase [Clostridia bacterium]|nr:GNAT family N-acetyltransferase [Clostridia bacterium]
MSSLKMYNFNPKVRGKALPEGFIVTKYKGDEDIPAWCEICSDGLIDPATAEQRFVNELINIDGPNPLRDTYFIEKDGKKIATYTVVPNMWSTGMGYIHMVAVKSEYRGLGLGSFIADDSLSKLIAMGKDKIFLLTGDKREAALSTYIKAGFLPVNYIDDENKDMVERWQNIVNNLKLKELTLLDNEGNFLMTLKQSE